MTNKNRLNRIKPMRFFIDYKSKFATNILYSVAL